MKKQILALFMGCVLLCGFSGCGKTSKATENKTTTTAVSNEKLNKDKDDTDYKDIDIKQSEKSDYYTPIEIKNGYNSLQTDDQRKFYDLVLESTNSVAEEKDENDIYPCSIVNMENTVLTQAEIRLVITAVKEDNPMLFWLTDKFGFSNTEGYTAIQLYSYEPPEKIKTMQNKLNKEVNKFINSVEKELAKKADTTDLDTKENISNKIDTINFPSTTYYPSSKAVWDYVTSKLSALINDIENLKNNKVNITDFNIFKDSTNSNISTNSTNIENLKNELAEKNKKINDLSIKITTDKAGTTTISDSSNNNIVGLNMYGKTTQSTTPTPTNPVAIKNINNPKITVTNDSDSQSINIQCTLRGIGNVCDTLTVNSDGTGYITQRLFAERITSQKKSTSYEWNYSKATHRFFRNDYSYSFDVKDNKPLILCSHLDVGENEKNTAFDNSIGWINVGGVGIAIRMTEFDGDIAKFKKWLDDNEVYVVAPQSKPITVNLSKDEVDKILSLHTYYPSTKISADADFEATYIADTRKYIDSKVS